jgi:hypothetical protein
MSDEVAIPDASHVQAIGNMIGALGESLQAQASDLLAQIDTIEAEKPWGNDDFGQQIVAGYTTVPPGGNQPFNELLKGYLQDNTALSTAGNALSRSVDTIQLAEVENTLLMARPVGE